VTDARSPTDPPTTERSATDHPDAMAERTCNVRREQRAVDEAKRFAELALSYCNANCRQAATMAVSEFAENLVKYSAADSSTGAGTIGIGVVDDKLRVRAVNAVCSAADARRVQETVARISSSNVKELYRTRLAELFKNPGLARAQLGLLRVAFEGGFRLSCVFEPPRLMIVAERPCGSAG
jgi:hypothetical protein